ncbi:MAG: ribosome biogenesis GTPase Der [Firmicutes bacterium]|nr:ribosome biogenesis GTPase Der [Bacillota bacterium]
MGYVALLGRPNVGKSALFNRITQTHRAIVEDVPGVTRDRLYEETEWDGRSFTLVDTGGIWFGDEDTILGMTRRQAEMALQEADVLVLVVDAREGPTAADQAVAELLRRSGKPVVLAANKAETAVLEAAARAEFGRLGLGDPVPVSALHGRAVDELLDRVVAALPAPSPEETEETALIRVALAGRPNVGKSSLVNALSGQERTLVTPIPGTTRDVVDIRVQTPEGAFLLLDTAGLRRPSRVEPGLEAKTVARSLDAIRRADVVLLVVDLTQGVSAQDQRIASQVVQAGAATVVVANKADLIKGTTLPAVGALRDRLDYLDWAPVIATSALTGWHLDQLWPAVAQAYQAYSRRVPTHLLNQVVQEAVHLNPPPVQRGKALKVFYAVQAAARPPRLLLFVNQPALAQPAYTRYLERRVRERFGFEGTPIRIEYRERRRRTDERTG